MRSILLVFALLFGLVVSAQEITLSYKNDQGTAFSVVITSETKEITISDVAAFKDFTVVVTNLPSNEKLAFRDFAGGPIGEWKEGDNKKPLHSGQTLNNTTLNIFTVDDKGLKKLFASVAVLDVLPPSSIDAMTNAVSLLGQMGEPCTPCAYGNSALVYDFAKNIVSYDKKKGWLGFKWGQPTVGKSYTFLVKNINPFRDSVVVSHETASFNTDVPELFTKAFFSAGSQGKDPNRDKLLADVLALGKQLDKLIETLKNAKECDDLCSVIAQVKKDVLAHFVSTYGLDPNKDIFLQLLQRLAGIHESQRSKVIEILNKLRGFYNTKNYFNYHVPQVENVDAYIFTLSIVPKANAKSNAIVDHMPITVNTVGGVKVDFSTGLFFTNLTDEKYLLHPDSSVIHNQYGGDSIVFNRRNQIVRLSQNNDFGVAALMHFYPRLTPVVNLALSLGAGLSIAPNPSIRYLAGGSLLIGKKGRLGITYGWAGGFVDVLADPYQNLQYVSNSEVKSITKRSFQTKGFWALSFNIPLFKTKVNTDAKPEETKKEETPGAEKKDAASK